VRVRRRWSNCSVRSGPVCRGRRGARGAAAPPTRSGRRSTPRWRVRGPGHRSRRGRIVGSGLSVLSGCIGCRVDTADNRLVSVEFSGRLSSADRASASSAPSDRAGVTRRGERLGARPADPRTPGAAGRSAAHPPHRPRRAPTVDGIPFSCARRTTGIGKFSLGEYGPRHIRSLEFLRRRGTGPRRSRDCNAIHHAP
jgi:hypothetical protein